MKKITFGLLTVLLIVCCGETIKTSEPKAYDFSNKLVVFEENDSTQIDGSSYLSVYSDVYSYSEKSRHNLTATISLRNLDESKELIIRRAEYFDTAGNSLKKYIQRPIRLNPLETINIIIDENDEAGGTGANFIFDWAIKKDGIEPLFEAVMISTKGQQGLSFITTGHRIK